MKVTASNAIAPSEAPAEEIPNPALQEPTKDIILCFLLSMGGFCVGYDSMNLNIGMPTIAKQMSLSKSNQSTIFGVLCIGAFMSCIAAAPLNHFFGRKKIIISSCVISILGEISTACSSNSDALVVSRFITGISIGLYSSSVPIFIAECALPRRRALLVLSFPFCISLGYLVCNLLFILFENQKHGWRFTSILNAFPSVVLGIVVFTMPESPRWLVLMSRDKEARMTFCWLHGAEETANEIIASIRNELDEQGRGRDVLLPIFRCRRTRKSLALMSFLFGLQSLTGISTMVFFSTSLFISGGFSVRSTHRFTACLLFVLVFAGLLPFFYIEKLGRKKLVLMSLLGVSCCQLITAAGFLFSYIGRIEIKHFIKPPLGHPPSHCPKYRFCYECTFDPKCGFCYMRLPINTHFWTIKTLNSSCLPVAQKDQRYSTYGPCVKHVGNKVQATFTFASRRCPTAKVELNVGIAGFVFFLMTYSAGTGPLPWLISVEIFPTWARSTGIGLSTSWHWAICAMISFSFLVGGTYVPRFVGWLTFSGFAFFGFLLLYWYMPESRETNMEQMDCLERVASEIPSLESLK